MSFTYKSMSYEHSSPTAELKFQKKVFKKKVKELFKRKIPLVEIYELLDKCYITDSKKNSYDIFIKQYFLYFSEHTHSGSEEDFNIVLAILKKGTSTAKSFILGPLFEKYIAVIFNLLDNSEKDFSNKLLDFLDALHIDEAGKQNNPYQQFLIMYYITVKKINNHIDTNTLKTIINRCNYHDLLLDFYYNYQNLEALTISKKQDIIKYLQTLLGPIMFGKCFQNMRDDEGMSNVQVVNLIMQWLSEDPYFQNKAIFMFRLTTEPLTFFKIDPERFIDLLYKVIPSTQEIIAQSKKHPAYFEQNFKVLIELLEDLIKNNPDQVYLTKLQIILANLYYAQSSYKPTADENSFNKLIELAYTIATSDTKGFPAHLLFDLGSGILDNLKSPHFNHYDPVSIEITALIFFHQAASNGHNKALEYFIGRSSTHLSYNPTKFGTPLVESKESAFEHKKTIHDKRNYHTILNDLHHKRIEDQAKRLKTLISSLKLKSKLSQDAKEVALRELHSLTNSRNESIELISTIAISLARNLKIIGISKDKLTETNLYMENISASIVNVTKNPNKITMKC